MTSPEQLQAWRVKFESFYSDDRECLLTRDANSGDYVNESLDSAWYGYLRRCQETEQALTPSEPLEELLGQYWDIGYKEGQFGEPNGAKANEVLHKIRLLFEHRSEAK